VRGAGITVFAQGVAFAGQMVATVVLARILLPADFGLVAMVTTLSLLLVNVGLIGFPEVTVQRDEMNHYLASNLFWINVSTALVLTLAFAAAGSLLAKFYGDPRVAGVAMGASLTIFITGTSVLHLALLQRGMRFSAISANDITSRLVSVAVSIFLAWAGWGYWSLVAGMVAQPLVASIGVWILCQWVPGFPRREAGTASMVRSAAHVYGRFSVDYFTHNMDYLLVGWRFGPIPLGFYKKAYELFVLPSNQFLSAFPVAISTLSRLNRNHVQYRRYFLGGLSILALVGMGVGADFTLVGKDLVCLLLGPRWNEAGRIFTFFGPGIGITLIYRTQGMIHLSLGTAGRYFRWALVEFAVTALLFLLALRWGPAGIALAWAAASWILIFPAFWYAGRSIQFGAMQVLGVIWKYVLASILAGWGCAVIVRGIPSLVTASGAIGSASRIATNSFLFGALYMVAVILLHRGCAPFYQLVGLLREMAPRGRLSKLSPAVAATSASNAGR
jgi:O-antigen/teichoic acid export membrane protein